MRHGNVLREKDAAAPTNEGKYKLCRGFCAHINTKINETNLTGNTLSIIWVHRTCANTGEEERNWFPFHHSLRRSKSFAAVWSWSSINRSTSNQYGHTLFWYFFVSSFSACFDFSSSSSWSSSRPRRLGCFVLSTHSLCSLWRIDIEFQNSKGICSGTRTDRHTKVMFSRRPVQLLSSSLPLEQSFDSLAPLHSALCSWAQAKQQKMWILFPQMLVLTITLHGKNLQSNFTKLPNSPILIGRRKTKSKSKHYFVFGRLRVLLCLASHFFHIKNSI